MKTKEDLDIFKNKIAKTYNADVYRTGKVPEFIVISYIDYHNYIDIENNKFTGISRGSPISFMNTKLIGSGQLKEGQILIANS